VFALAITTFDRREYLAQLLESWEKTRWHEVDWFVLVADDGSSDGTLEYLKTFDFQNIPIEIIQNRRKGIGHQSNTLIQKLETMEFDLCFRVDDDIVFLKSGWDRLYFKTIQETGYDHLCFYDAKKWNSNHNLSRSAIEGDLECRTAPVNVQGCFYTLTPRVIAQVGYMDVQNFGLWGLEHIDYTWRCCRAGFNQLRSPFDLRQSNEYVTLVDRGRYRSALPDAVVQSLNPPWVLRRKRRIISQERVYVPYQIQRGVLNERSRQYSEAIR
jgi:glycosyltransferase involved in cell wall biosynthesis